MKSKIEIIISEDGTTEIKVSGHKGQGCQALTREIEKALGRKTKDSKTHEFFEKDRNAKLKLGG